MCFPIQSFLSKRVVNEVVNGGKSTNGSVRSFYGSG